MNTNNLLEQVVSALSVPPEAPAELEAISVDTDALVATLGADVRGFLGDKLDSIVTTLQGVGLVPTGTTFPGEPQTGSMFYRTDLEQWFKRESGQWVSAVQIQPIPPYTVGAYSGAAGALLGVVAPPWPSYRVRRIVVSFFVPSTLNGSNFWGVQITNSDLGVINTLNMGTYFPNAWYAVETNLSSANQTLPLQFRAPTKTGAPGALSWAVSLGMQRVIAD